MECFKKIAAHMLKGLMYHRDMEDYFRFLGYEELANEQRMHYLDESNNFACLHKQYMQETGCFLDFEIPKYESVIPENWYNYKTTDVDNGTRQKSLKNIFEIWKNWEIETISLYEESIHHFRNTGNDHCAFILERYLKDTSAELKSIKSLWTEFEINDWNPSNILATTKERNNG